MLVQVKISQVPQPISMIIHSFIHVHVSCHKLSLYDGGEWFTGYTRVALFL